MRPWSAQRLPCARYSVPDKGGQARTRSRLSCRVRPFRRRTSASSAPCMTRRSWRLSVAHQPAPLEYQRRLPCRNSALGRRQFAWRPPRTVRGDRHRRRTLPACGHASRPRPVPALDTGRAAPCSATPHPPMRPRNERTCSSVSRFRNCASGGSSPTRSRMPPPPVRKAAQSFGLASDILRPDIVRDLSSQPRVAQPACGSRSEEISKICVNFTSATPHAESEWICGGSLVGKASTRSNCRLT